MPSKSPAQRRLMAAAAHDPAFAKKVGVPQSVAKDFNRADKGLAGVMGDVRMKDELGMRQRFAEETIREERARKRREQLEKSGKRMA